MRASSYCFQITTPEVKEISFQKIEWKNEWSASGFRLQWMVSLHVGFVLIPKETDLCDQQFVGDEVIC